LGVLLIDIEDILIDENSTMIEAMRVLDQVAIKVLFVVKEGQLIAALSDGDIRRWILKKGNLDAKVNDIANYNPKFIFEKDKAIGEKYMRKNSIEALPIIDQNRKIVSVMLWCDKEIDNGKALNLPVVVMAGGLGERLYPYTKILPKPLIPIGEIPITEHIINRFHKYGCQRFYLIVNHKKNMIKAYFNEIEKNYLVTYVDEEKPLGTGGGLSLLKGRIKSTFILTNCDILIEADYEKIYRFHKKEKNLITMVCSLKKIRIPYGIIEIREDGEIDNMKEKPEMYYFTNTGCYIVEPKVIEEAEEDKVADFPDIIADYINAGEKVRTYPISENAWMDMGQLDEMEEMKKRLGEK
jgi:dTDP-glucose pyrophosphorylase